jgi:hypothetical protein
MARNQDPNFCSPGSHLIEFKELYNLSEKGTLQNKSSSFYS